MEDPEPPAATAGPSQPEFWHPAERRSRKSGSHNIFQGVNLRELRRLFQVAGEQDAEQRARLVWGRGGGRGAGRGGEEEEDGGEAGQEAESGLAQALVGLRVRSRNRTGIRAEAHRDIAAGTRWVRAFGHLRINAGSSGQPDVIPDDVTEPGACGGLDSAQEGSTADQVAPVTGEQIQGASGGPSWSRAATAERDPEHYLHRIRH